MGVWIFLLTFLAGCIIVRKWQTKRIKFYFQPTFTVWKDFLAETKLNTLRYQPSLFTLTSELQMFWFPWVELWQKATDKLKYTREIFTLSDGGECALDWVEHQNSVKEIRDIVVVVPGLSGASDQLYCREMAKACLASNLDCVVVNYRGLANVSLKVSDDVHKLF
jgi:predicted alpha/beta-fold hydrolase